MVKKTVVMVACVALLAGASMFSGCKKKDTEMPTIEIVMPNAQEHEVKPGESLLVRVVVKDNEALGSVKLNIHWAGDGHTHEGHDHHHGASMTRGEEKVKFSYNYSVDLKGKSATVEQRVKIPANAVESVYHLEVACVDLAGNETGAFQEIHIEND